MSGAADEVCRKFDPMTKSAPSDRRGIAASLACSVFSRPTTQTATTLAEPQLAFVQVVTSQWMPTGAMGLAGVHRGRAISAQHVDRDRHSLKVRDVAARARHTSPSRNVIDRQVGRQRTVNELVDNAMNVGCTAIDHDAAIPLATGPALPNEAPVLPDAAGPDLFEERVQ